MGNITKNILLIVLGAVVITVASVGFYYYMIIQNVVSDDPEVWESEIRAFEENDEDYPVPEGSIVFAGSSSIKFWDSLAEQMAPLPVLNRGFGGAKITDVLHYAPRIILPYKPEIVVFYCGDNDMSVGRIQTPGEVLDNYQAFVNLVHEQLPETRIYFISIKPSTTRWEYWPEMAKANQLIEQYSNENEKLAYIDISSSMLDDTGKPREDILTFDGIHMNAEGYEIWASIIKPILVEAYNQ